MAIWTRVDPTKLYQPFRQQLELVLDACERRGRIYVPISGVRTLAEQAELYSHGRNGDTRPVVTWAPAGYSPHNWGVAADCVLDTDADKTGIQPDWKPEAYKMLAEEAQRVGLEPGLLWPAGKRDPDHVQLHLEKYAIEWQDLLDVEKVGGMDAVFNFLDQFQWGSA